MKFHGNPEWKTWRVETTEDYSDNQLPAIFLPAWFATEGVLETATNPIQDMTVGGLPATTFEIRGFGQDTAADVARVQFVGFMNKTDPGLGKVLWEGSATLHTASQVFKPHRDTVGDAGGTTERWGAGTGTWFEAATWTPDTNACGAVSLVGSAGSSSLMLPTLGYTSIVLVINKLDGAGEALVFGVLWRPVNYDGVSILL